MHLNVNCLMVNDLVKRGGKILKMKPYMFTECNFEPIEITPDLLCKLAFNVIFEYSPRTSYVLYDVDDRPIVDYSISKDEIEIKNTLRIYIDDTKHFQSNDVKYLHELQNVMRMCGLGDIADKFEL